MHEVSWMNFVRSCAAGLTLCLALGVPLANVMATEGSSSSGYPVWAFVATGVAIDAVVGLAVVSAGLLAIVPSVAGQRWTLRGLPLVGIAAVLAELHAAVAWTLGGVLATGTPLTDTASAFGLSLLVPGIPLIVICLPGLRTRLWTPPRRPATLRAHGSAWRATRSVPYAPLPPFPHIGAPPLPGQVWEVFFPFEEQPGGKRRPALIVGVGADGVTALKVTSQDKSQKTRYFVPIDNSGWQAMTLPGKRSWVEFGKPTAIPRTQVLRPLGLCSPQPLWNHIVARYRLRTTPADFTPR
jgi:hypothetical protein